MTAIEFVLHRPDPGGGGGGRVPSWLKEAPGNAEDLEGVMKDAASSIEGVASTVGSKTESALPSVYQSVGACEASTYGSELTESLGFLGEEFGVAETRLGEYATEIGDVKDRAVDLDSQISAAISDYADAISDRNELPDDAEDSEVDAADDVVNNKRWKMSNLYDQLADVLEEARGLDRSYAAQLDAVTSEIQDTTTRIGEISGSIRNGTSVTVALSNLNTEIEDDSESMPLSDDELAEQHAKDLQEAIDNEDWDEVERILAEMEVHNDNPDYAEAFTRELGPVAAADLLTTAMRDMDPHLGVDVVNAVSDTVLNGLEGFETEEMMDFMDIVLKEESVALLLLLSSDEGNGMPHSFSLIFLRALQNALISRAHYPEFFHLLFGDEDILEFIAGEADPEALIEVLDELDERQRFNILSNIVGANWEGGTGSAFEELIVLTMLQLNGDSARTDLLVEWLKMMDTVGRSEELSAYFHDPTTIPYLIGLADDDLLDDEWVAIADAFDEADMSDEEVRLLLEKFMEQLLQDDSVSPDEFARKMGLLLNLVESAGIDVDYNFWNGVISEGIGYLAGEIPGGSQVKGLIDGWLDKVREMQEQKENLATEFGEESLNKMIAFYILLAEGDLPPEVAEALNDIPPDELDRLDPENPEQLLDLLAMLGRSSDEAVKDWLDELNRLKDLVDDRRDQGLDS